MPAHQTHGTTATMNPNRPHGSGRDRSLTNCQRLDSVSFSEVAQERGLRELRFCVAIKSDAAERSDAEGNGPDSEQTIWLNSALDDGTSIKYKGFTMASKRVLLGSLTLAHFLWFGLLPTFAAAEPAQTQIIKLDPGWNLVAFQVLPLDANPAAVFSALSDNFVAAWTVSRDATATHWLTFARPGSKAPEANGAAILGPIEIGRAYWIYVNQAVPAWQIIGTAPAQVPPVDLFNGWNLISVPTGTGNLTEPVSIGAVFAAAGLDYDTILRWEAGLYDKFTPADGDVDDFSVFDANKGYWVNLKSASFRLQPKLLSSVRGDADAEPQGNYPGPEDLKLSASPTPLGPTNQTHLVFLPGEDTQQLALANTGGGILLWRLEWTPTDAPGTPAPWLKLSDIQGVTTIENDVIKLYIDRTHLVQGTYRGRLKLVTTAGNREFEVVAHVPGLSGEWRGAARAETANGRRNALPEIDLHLSFYEDPKIPGLVRGFIDSRNALLWPVDVPLIGHVLDAAGNAFSLSGGYVLPPGDQNNPPYDLFDKTREDVDWNCDGKLDDLNPYPFPLYRSVTLNGSLVRGSPLAGYEITGRYTEVVYGLLRQSIRVEGSFSIRRENPRPFANRRPLLNEPETGTQPVVLKGLAAPIQVSSSRFTNTVNFTTDMVLLDMAVDLDLDSPAGRDIRATLIGPDGKQALLLNRGDISSLRNLSFPSARRPVQSFASQFIDSGAATRGDWKLALENAGPPFRLKWSLRLHGQPVFDLAGRVTDIQGNPLPAPVALNGLAIGEVAQAAADGSFLFRRLPGIPLNLSSLLGGFLPADPLVPGLDSRFTLPHFPLDCDTPAKQALAAKFRVLPVMAFPAFATAGIDLALGTTAKPVELRLIQDLTLVGNSDPALLATPVFGPAPLEVLFEVRNAPGTALIWRMGDGTNPKSLDVLTRRYTYATPRSNGYTAQVTGDGNPFAAATTVYPLPSPRNSPYALNFFQVFFSSGGSVPADLNVPGGNDPTQPAVRANLLTVQHAYAASFDLDLGPANLPGTSFYSDNFDPAGLFTGANGQSANRADNFKDEDYNYRVAQGDRPGEWLLSAECGYGIDDDIRHPHPRLGASGECKELPRYRMVCNLGPQILPTTPAEVFAVPESGSPPQLPPPQSGFGTGFGASGVAVNRSLRLVTGPLAALAVHGGAQ